MTEDKIRTSRERPRPREVQWTHAGPAFVLGFLTCFIANQYAGGILPVADELLLVLTGAAYAALSLTRVRRVLPWVSAMAIVAYVVLGWTPLLDGSIRAWAQTDPPRKGDAVVVLSSDAHLSGKPFRVCQVRLLAGYEAIADGLAPVLVITRIAPPRPSMLSFAREQMRRLKLNAELVETPEPVRNTHDEAVAVAKLAHQRGWKRVVLVTDLLHLRRSGALFEHEGLEVVRRPCLENDFDLSRLRAPVGRLTAFREWLHEWIGWQVYRRRGWL